MATFAGLFLMTQGNSGAKDVVKSLRRRCGEAVETFWMETHSSSHLTKSQRWVDHPWRSAMVAKCNLGKRKNGRDLLTSEYIWTRLWRRNVFVVSESRLREDSGSCTVDTQAVQVYEAGCFLGSYPAVPYNTLPYCLASDGVMGCVYVLSGCA